MFGQGVRKECPEIRDNDAESDYGKSVGEDDVWRIDGLSGFRDRFCP